jgi:hypothetical protein
MGSVGITLAAKPGLFMGVTYFPNTQRRGIPLDSITWVTTDMQGGISAEYEVRIGTECSLNIRCLVVSILGQRLRYSCLQVVFCVNLGTFFKCFLQLRWRLTGVRSTHTEYALNVP